ncbi:MAG: DUF5131 family protein [Bryobacter sp.]|jgi:protein gp37|nr:DUF5131 family protein [Bryobacter sp.]
MNAIVKLTENVIEFQPAGEVELLEREQRIERAQRNAYYEIGLELRTIREKELYKVKRGAEIAGRYSFETWEEYITTRWDWTNERARQVMQAAEAAQKLQQLFDISPSRESHVRALLALEADDERAAAWKAVVEKHGSAITAKDVEAEVALLQAAKAKNWHTLEEWAALTKDERAMALAVRDSEHQFNKQDNDSIEWARWSWNPVTGCKHDCPYCYARDIAARFYPQGFEPSLHPGRLAGPLNTKVPAEADRDVSYRNVFTCSMADLFGRWVPKEWIEAVLATVRSNPQWNFLFLTKFPKRMAEFDIPDNAWMGTTVDMQKRVKAAEDAFSNVGGKVRWLSVEPMLEPIKFEHLDRFQWVVIGGASGSTQTPAWIPPLDWMVDLHAQARAAGCRIYYKTNAGLTNDLRLREFPWGEAPTTKALPKEMHYLGKV